MAGCTGNTKHSWVPALLRKVQLSSHSRPQPEGSKWLTFHLSRVFPNVLPSLSPGMPAVLLPCTQGTGCGVENSLKASQGLFLLTKTPSVILLGDHNLSLAREDSKSFFQHQPPPHQDRSPRELAQGHQGCACFSVEKAVPASSPICAERPETKI